MPPPLLKRGDTRLAEVDRGIRNPFRWDWLDVKVNIEVAFSSSLSFFP